MGSCTHIVDDREILNQYEDDAWGNVVNQKETVKNRFKFNGQQLDPITKQYYLRARFYNPIIARFTQEDTYRGDGLNLYAYCANNPVYYIDPSGNDGCPKGEELIKNAQYQPRTEKAYKEAQYVAKTLDKILHDMDSTSEEYLMKKPYDYHPVVAVFTHKDGTVSVGLSGKSGSRIMKKHSKALEKALTKGGKKIYTVSSESINIQKLKRPTNDLGQPIGNDLGQCAEPKAAKAASSNTSEIDGFNVVWRGNPKDNNHKPKKKSPYYKKGDYEQMNPCKTCKLNESEYMRNANANKINE